MKKERARITRRMFIRNSAGAIAAVSAHGLIPMSGGVELSKSLQPAMEHRKLGKTGLDVSILSFGGGSQFLRNPDGTWEKMIETALDGGINLFDTAPGYIASKMGQIWDGKSVDSSEERYGKILPSYRKKIVLSTKLDTRNPDEAKAEFESSLRKLKTDHVDLLFIHAIDLPDNISDIEKGVYRSVVSFKESGAARYIGFSSMGDATLAAGLLEKLDFDVVLLAMNATQYGDFARLVLPVARKKNTGVMSMKLMRDIVGKEAAPAELFNYALSLDGVATGLIGHAGIDALKDNINVARAFTAGSFGPDKRRELEARLSHLSGPHTLSWARPGYRDWGLHEGNPTDLTA